MMPAPKLTKAEVKTLAAAADVLERIRYHTLAGSIRALRAVRDHTEKDA